MTQKQWTAVEEYLCQKLVQPDPALGEALAACEKSGLPAISVAPVEGKLLQLFARLIAAKNILEIGTLAGYSTIWLARALPPEGHLITLEVDEKHAAVALENIAKAGLADMVELRLGKAIETLPRLAAEGRGPFDLIFIDADKASLPDYFAWSLKLARRGSLIIVDNVVREGAVIDAHSSDPSVHGVRRLMEILAAEPRVSCTALQTVGSKGYDGFAVALVVGD